MYKHYISCTGPEGKAYFLNQDISSCAQLYLEDAECTYAALFVHAFFYNIRQGPKTLILCEYVISSLNPWRDIVWTY